MKAVRKTKQDEGLSLEEVPIPTPKAGEVLLKIRASSLCGTDVHIYKWHSPWNTRINVPRTLGHEFCGDVVEVGPNVAGFSQGDFVSAESHIWCNSCFQCKIGNRHICQNMKLLGVDVDGGFAQYVTVPAQNLWKNPKNMSPQVATLQESLGNSVYTVFSGEVEDQTFTIFGLGPTGMFATGVAKAGGAKKVIVVGDGDFQLDIAKKMGADVCINRFDQDVESVIMEETEHGSDVFLDMAGAEAAIRQGLRTLRPGGRVTLLGLPPKPISLEWSGDVVLKEAHINGVWGRKVWGTWERMSNLLENGLDITPIITHELNIEDFEKAIELASSGKSGKIILSP